jgi:hypothetical protein
MNFNLKVIIFSLVICLCFQVSQAYVCTARLMIHKTTGQRVIVFSDCHDETTANIVQRQSILNYAKKYNMYLVAEDNGFRCDYVGPDDVIAYPACFQDFLDALVEDPVNFDPNARYSGDFSILDPKAKNETSPLLLLIPMAKNLNIKAKTIECRQAEKISHRNGPISARQVCQAYDALATQVATFNDGTLFNDFYKQKLNEYYERRALAPEFFKYLESCSSNLKKAFQNKKFVAEVSAAYEKVEFQNHVSEYLSQGANLDTAKALAASSPVRIDEEDGLYVSFMLFLHNFLIDAAAVHEIATHPQEPIIMAYCGAWHIDSIMPVLRRAGFHEEKIWDASKKLGQSAVNLDAFFEKISSQLKESIHIHPAKSATHSLLALALVLIFLVCSVGISRLRKAHN